MINNFDKNVTDFLDLAYELDVQMIMVGGGAVNFHGYQRHSADVDFWINNTETNLEKLSTVFTKMGYEISEFPKEVKDGLQNVSIKLSPFLELELITRFDINKTFEEALQESEIKTIGDKQVHKFNLISYDDLITSKMKAGRPKDLLDIQELQRIKNL